jgi:transposase
MCPQRSPDLNPCHYFLWSYLKSRVYRPLPKSLDELKANIEREINSINSLMFEKVFVNLEKRLDLVIEADGGHF